MKDCYKNKTLHQLYGKIGGMNRVCNQCDGNCEDYEASGYTCGFDFDYYGVTEAIKELENKKGR